MPPEDAIRRNCLVQDGRQHSHFEVLVCSDEAAAIASSLGASGERDHVPSLQSEGANAIVQLRFGQGIHVATRVLCAEAVATVSLELLLSKDGQRLVVPVIRHDDAATAIELHLAVAVVDCSLAIYLHLRQPFAYDHGRLHLSEDEDCMFGIGDVHQTLVFEGCGARYQVVNVFGQRDGRRDLHDRCPLVGSRHRERQPKQKEH